MSRSKKGSKGSGYDYWGNRALSGDCGCGKDVKKATIRKERRDAKTKLQKGETVDRQWDK